MNTNVNPRLPSFFLAGVPKAGTTSLYHYLDEHPEIYMSPIKEPAFFSLEIRLENFGADMRDAAIRDLPLLREYLDGAMTTKRFGGPVTEWADYLRLFHNVRQEKAVGEASVCYLWSETAPQSIAERVPDAKIILILRDPAQRAFSHYLQAVRGGIARGTFRDYIETDLNCRDKEFTFRHPFLAFGSYHRQVERYREHFPESNILVLLYDDYTRNAPALVRQIFAFLGVNPDFMPDMTQRHLEAEIPRFESTRTLLLNGGAWQRVRKLVPTRIRRALRPTLLRNRTALSIPPADRAFLVQYYNDDIRNTARLINRDLSAWLAA